MNYLPGEIHPKTLDWDLEHKKAVWLDPNFTTDDAFNACKSTLCKLIDREQYKEASELYDQIVNTGIYGISGCWKTGLLLVKKNGEDPIAYLEAAHRMCRNKHKVAIFLAYIDELMKAHQIDAVIDNLDTVWAAVHGKNQDVQDIQAYLNGVKTTENWIRYLRSRCENVPRKSEFAPTWLPTDEAVIKEYLDMLRTTDHDAFEQAAIALLRRTGQESDLELMRVVLKYYTPPLKPFTKWLELMVPYNELDPTGDPSIFANPFFEACMNRFEYWNPRKPETFKEYDHVYHLLKDRLEAAKYDQWTIDKLSWLCTLILSMENFRKQFTYAKLIHADELGQIVESKIGDLIQEEHSSLKALKKPSKKNERKRMRVIGDIHLKVSAFEQLHALLDSVHRITVV